MRVLNMLWRILKTILKAIILGPIALLLLLGGGILLFISYLGATILSVLSVLMGLGALMCFFVPPRTIMVGITGLVLAFAISPYGLPLVASVLAYALVGAGGALLSVIPS